MGVDLRRSWLCRASVRMEQSLNELWISRTSVRKGDVVQRGVRRYRSAFGWSSSSDLVRSCRAMHAGTAAEDNDNRVFDALVDDDGKEKV